LGIVEAGLKARHLYDEVFCVFDRNGHPNFDAALASATAQKGITVLPSHPCFEFWLLLHFQYTRAPFAAVGVKSACERLTHVLKQQGDMAACEKGGVKGLFDNLLGGGRFAQARQRAAQAHAEAIELAEPNPSTRIHLLIDRLESLGRLRPLN
jgi:RloB-like protein